MGDWGITAARILLWSTVSCIHLAVPSSAGLLPGPSGVCSAAAAPPGGYTSHTMPFPVYPLERGDASVHGLDHFVALKIQGRSSLASLLVRKAVTPVRCQPLA